MNDETPQETESKPDPVGEDILAALAPGKELSMQAMARLVADLRAKPKDKKRKEYWRKYMTAVKQQAVHLARQGRIEIVRKGEAVDPNDFKGIVKLRLPKK